MKRLSLISILLLTVLSAGCRRDMPEDTRGERPELGITLAFPAPAMTKARTEVPASAAENAVNDLKIWVFRHDNHALVASLELDASTSLADDFPQAGGVKRYSLPVSWDFALERPRPAVDIFVLANSASVTLSEPLRAKKVNNLEVSSYDEVSEALFDGVFYATRIVGSEDVGPQSARYAAQTVPADPDPTPASAFPETGLPMSGVATNLSVSGEEPALSVATVSLERCVSKIRFLFCQMETEGNPEELETFRVDKIVLDGNQIPSTEYLFTETPPCVGGGYVAKPLEMTGSDGSGYAIQSSPTPELYVYAGGDGTAYETIIADAVKDSKLTDCGTLYLPESDKQLTGTIYYTVTTGANTNKASSRSATATFSMAVPGDFARNHSWTVYGYYISDRTLQLSINVLPWDKSDYTIDFSTSALMVTGKLSVLSQTVESITKVSGDDWNVVLKGDRSANAYMYVATPQGGKLEVIPEGTNSSEEAFWVSFSGDPMKDEPLHVRTIDPSDKNGRIDIYIDRNIHYTGPTSGLSITLNFRAFAPDGDREIEGASECIDQIYHFFLQ